MIMMKMMMMIKIIYLMMICSNITIINKLIENRGPQQRESITKTSQMMKKSFQIGNKFQNYFLETAQIITKGREMSRQEEKILNPALLKSRDLLQRVVSLDLRLEDLSTSHC
jgi:hypothetical protein